MAVIEWDDDAVERAVEGAVEGAVENGAGVPAVLASVRLGCSDAHLVAAADGADVLGVDCPLGWPLDFVAMVLAHEQFRLAPPPISGERWRRQLTLRHTDQYVQARTGLTPLRVSADLIAHPAMRWAGVAAQLAQQGHDVCRDGSGLIAEVYPAAALKTWGLPHRGYKGGDNRTVRDRLVADVLGAAPWLDLGGFDALCVESDHALDAVLCALLARAVRSGLTEPPDDDDRARVEGWIHLPTVGLAELSGGRLSSRAAT